MTNSKSMSSENDIWKLGRLNHVAIATPNLTEASKFYKDVLRAKVGKIATSHDVTIIYIVLRKR